jgi:hypothetical protein
MRNSERSLQRVAVARSLGFRSTRPADGGDAGGVSHGDEADDHEEDVGDSLPWTGGDGAVVHQGLCQEGSAFEFGEKD